MRQSIPPHIQAIWDGGDKIQAIKLLREATGLGLAETKGMLESAPSEWMEQSLTPSQTLPANVRTALDNGNKIEAIKLLRKATGLGLKEAKNWIEASDPSAIPPHESLHHSLSPGEVPRGNYRFMVSFIVVIATVIAAWFLFHS